MARTVDQIYRAIIETKEATPALSVLTSNSQTAIWRLWAYITAVAIHTFEVTQDLFKAEVEANIAARQSGTPAWYVEQVKKFQAGDVLNEEGKYAVIDPSKQIVTRCSYKEAEDGAYKVLQLKVAKGVSPDLIPLTGAEQYQLKYYLDKVRFAGTKIQVISLNGDKLQLSAEVFYDAIRPVEQVREAVEAALNNYLQNIDFDGNIYLSKLQDAIQGVDGVIDVVIEEAVAVVGETDTTIDRVYQTASGYITEDTSTGNSFSDLITYTANI